MSKQTVFISYSHNEENEIWKDRLVTHLNSLQLHDDVDFNIWHDRLIYLGANWRDEIQKAMNSAKIAILMISAEFLSSKFINEVEVPYLLERKEKDNLKIVSVIVKPSVWQRIKWLSEMQLCPKDGKPLKNMTDSEADEAMSSIANEIANMLGYTMVIDESRQGSQLIPIKISTAKMPTTSPDVFGREKEIKMLDEAWEDTKTNIVTLVAFGGVGKTALVNKWLNNIKADNYRAAERVLAWSFYSQGAAEGKQASTDQFIAFALRWFGDPKPDEGSHWDKGERLAELVRKYRTLLVLDGLEPLQNPSDCRIKDPALCCLLKELAHDNQGLCVVMTRLEVDDIKDDVGNSVEKVELERLSAEAGAQLLKKLGVQGTPEELKQAVGDLDGHALALTLLGTYLKTVYHGDIRYRKEIARLTDERKQGAHARRVMESYEQWFKGKPELDILFIMGLFDKPAEMGAIDAVRKEPIIDGLTDKLQGLSFADWKFAIENLRTARLLDKEDEHNPDELDCHPLVREHFGEKLKANNPKAWEEAHSRLYEWYKTTAKEYPDTIEEMAPLYSAVSHGCQAGRWQETMDEVYWQRISRGNEFYSMKKLGIFGADLSALSGFFDVLWSKPVDGLSEDDKAFVLNQSGFCLRALSRLSESAQPMQASMEMSINQKDWKGAAQSVSNLSELYLIIGDTTKALDYAEQSVELADQSGDAGWRMASRTGLADAQHQIGSLAEAEDTFKIAEEIQKELQPKYSYLYSLQGFQYCDLLLEQGKYEEVIKRAIHTLELEKTGQYSLLSIALDHLSLGHAYMLKAQMEKVDFTKAIEHLDQAVNGLRQSGQHDYIAFGLLTRAYLRRIQKDLEKAKHDIDEALIIASRGGMGLHLVDCHFEYARFYFDMGEKEKAKENLAIAKEMIEKMGYHRRDKELEELKVKG